MSWFLNIFFSSSDKINVEKLKKIEVEQSAIFDFYTRLLFFKNVYI